MRSVAPATILIVLTALLPAKALSMAERPDDSRIYYFDGSRFSGDVVAGQPAIATRTGYLPWVPAPGSGPGMRMLPAGTGALAGVCYLQQSGGKLGRSSAIVLLTGAPVTIRGVDVAMETRCDEQGYFALALKPGSYEVRSGADSRRVTVEADRTTLTPLRGGKRMVD